MRKKIALLLTATLLLTTFAACVKLDSNSESSVVEAGSSELENKASKESSGKSEDNIIVAASDSPQNSSEEMSTEVSSESSEESSEDSSSEEISENTDTKRIGKENYGYVDIPKTWIEFVDVDVEADIVQYTDAGGSIITLAAAFNPDADPEIIMNAYAAQMEDEGAESVIGVRGSLNGIEAVQVYGVYTSENLLLVAWAFKSDDGYMHIISAEGPPDKIVDVVSYLETSYALEA